MPLTIRVEDHHNNSIAELFDQKGLLNSIINSSYELQEQIKILKYIDLYDDTTLNSLQVKDFLIDIEYIKNIEVLNTQKLQVLEELVKMSNLALKEPHLYLKFYGD